MLNVHARAPISSRNMLLVMMALLVEAGYLTKADAARAVNTNQELFDRMHEQTLDTAREMAADMLASMPRQERQLPVTSARRRQPV